MSHSRVCAVFGGTRGIGKAISERFLREGFKVAVLGRDPEAISKYQEKNVNEDRILALHCDVTSSTSVEDSVQSILVKYGHISVLVNCAGVNRDRLLLRTSMTDINEQINTNLTGTILTCQAVVRHMIQNKSGSIINIGSIVGLKGNQGQCVYSATKAGLVGFTKSLAKEVASRGITVNLIAPGFIETDMTATLSSHQLDTVIKRIPLKKLGQPQEVAEVAMYLAGASYITGQVLCVDGGLGISIP
ncbi:carbonyl reductase family member 4 [Lingula anatina]|uniref:3-ketoacyl-[acyl-carrier-protein] reductase beta subunit n=1 Tax=Lingula anatina TaxID=7574 RepID=A0A1S3IGM9_LINAN|nr:carbonyl reductase family member 4 [Lingula anatina]|eukprot:XP_013397021.1 carbonyl reductase family member 4 [Lingula anatina]